MTKLNLVLESVRDEFLANSLEESDSEVTILKRKHFLNENINFMKKVIIEENVLGTARNTLNNSWIKRNPVAAGTGAAVGTAAGVAGLFSLMSPETTSDTFSGDTNNSVSNIKDTHTPVDKTPNINDNHAPIDKTPLTAVNGYPQLSIDDKFALEELYRHSLRFEYDYENDVFRRSNGQVISPETYDGMFDKYNSLDEETKNKLLEHVKKDRENFLVPELSTIKKPPVTNLTFSDKMNFVTSSSNSDKNYIYDSTNDVIKHRYSKDGEYKEITPGMRRHLFHKYQEDNGITKYDKRENEF